ncbi:MAG: helix-turn-helix domain-containing protein [Pseudomonadales bacterium]|nr:helix-turn-helix domain-containing protein [Pseudomonadales bacterium]
MESHLFTENNPALDRTCRQQRLGRPAKRLAKNIRRLRCERSLSQEGLADSCGLHRTYVGSVERGERNFTLSSLEVLAKTLNVSVVDLLTPRNEWQKFYQMIKSVMLLQLVPKV